MKVTQKTIADALGLSVNAVSLALRNHRSIPRRTQERVKHKARELGYRPNPLVSALMQERRMHRPSNATVIAYLTLDDHLRDSGLTVRKGIYQGLCKRGAELGFKVEEFCFPKLAMRNERLEQVLLARGIQGIIIAPPERPCQGLDLDCSPFSVVAIGFNLRSPKVNRIEVDSYATMVDTITVLEQLGYRNPALIVPKIYDQNINYQWSSAFVNLTRILMKQRNPAIFTYEELGPPLNRVSPWLKRQQPDIIISYCWTIWKLLQHEGVRVPEDVGYISLSPDATYPVAHLARYPLQIGKSAIETLAGQLYRNERGVPLNETNVLVMGRFVLGETVRNLRNANPV